MCNMMVLHFALRMDLGKFKQNTTLGLSFYTCREDNRTLKLCTFHAMEVANTRLFWKFFP